MGVPAQLFEGLSTRVPDVYVKQKFPPSLGATGVAQDIVAIVGSARGGNPYNAANMDDQDRVNFLTSVEQAQNLLRGGNGYYMTEFFLTPSGDPNLSAPSRCMFVRIDPSTQGSAVLRDAGLNDQINLKTVRWGAEANQLARKIEAGTNIGKKVTVRFKGSTVGEEDDVGFEYFEIQYVGAGSAATMNVSGTQLDTTVVGGPGGEDLVLLFSEYVTIAELVAKINDHPAYNALLKGRNDDLSNTLDAVAAQDIKSAAYTTLANVEALIQWFNANSGGEITAEWDGATPRAEVANDAGFVFFTGGTDGVPTSLDWAGAFTLLKKFRVNHVLAATGDAAIHSMLSAHLIEMSNAVNKANRSGGVGASLTTLTASARIAEAKALNNARLEYWITPIIRPDYVNRQARKTFDPFYCAALAAGIRFGNHLTISATFKSVNVLGVTEKYDFALKNQYIDAGCSYLDSDDAITVGHNVSTFQSGASLVLNLPSVLRTCDFITLDSRDRVKRRIANMNRAPNDLMINDLVNFIGSNILPSYVREGYLTRDVETGRKPFSDVKFRLYGDRFEYEFTGVVVTPLHYGFLTQKFVVPGTL